MNLSYTSQVIILIIILTFFALRYIYSPFMSPQKIQNLYSLIGRFHHFCKKYNVEYFALCGTLLGAVRENQIITHDDDIDVGMMDTEYEKLKNLKDILYSEFKITFHDSKKGIPKLYDNLNLKTSKSQGEFIDIFIYEKQGNVYIFKNQQPLELFPQEYFFHKELFPLKKEHYIFGKHKLDGPNNAIAYLKRVYGKTWCIPKLNLMHQLLFPEFLFCKPKTLKGK